MDQYLCYYLSGCHLRRSYWKRLVCWRQVRQVKREHLGRFRLWAPGICNHFGMENTPVSPERGLVRHHIGHYLRHLPLKMFMASPLVQVATPLFEPALLSRELGSSRWMVSVEIARQHMNQHGSCLLLSARFVSHLAPSRPLVTQQNELILTLCEAAETLSIVSSGGDCSKDRPWPQSFFMHLPWLSCRKTSMPPCLRDSLISRLLLTRANVPPERKPHSYCMRLTIYDNLGLLHGHPSSLLICLREAIDRTLLIV